jgi:hypothetical protein
VDAPVAPQIRPAAQRVEAAAMSAGVLRRQTPTSKGSHTGLLLGAVFVLLLLVSAVIGRNEIVAGIPASAAIYQRLGLPVEEELGLEFADVKSDWQVEGGASVLVVEGEIVNLSEGSRAIPPVRITILDGDGRELQHENFSIDPEVLDGGGAASFSGRLINPVERGENFRLTFDLDS